MTAESSGRTFVGISPAAHEIRTAIDSAARSNGTVLIRGETGSGKGLVARAIHAGGARSARPMVHVDCAAFAPSLLESELFGSEHGAFTGAVARGGLLEASAGGTIFLDEVGELPATSQAKLLTALEDRRVRRIGSTRTIPLDARFIAATNRPLHEMTCDGTFRSDLFFRLNVLPLWIPPLRERVEDVPVLWDHFRANRPEAPPLTAEGRRWLMGRAWPGNVRQLANVFERVTSLAPGRAPDASLLQRAATEGHTNPPWPELVPKTARDFAEALVRSGIRVPELLAAWLDAATRAHNHNKSAAARALGIGRRQLERRLNLVDRPEGELTLGALRLGLPSLRR